MAMFSVSLSIASWWHVRGPRGKTPRIFNLGISKIRLSLRPLYLRGNKH